MNYSVIDTLLHKEVIPAIGCTEPIAVSLCVAKACETLGTLPTKIEVALSPNVYKNAMGVGIPNTGMTGLPIAVALGAVAGKSEYELEVLKDADSAAVEQAKSYLNSAEIKIDIDRQTEQILYIRVEAFAGEDVAVAAIEGAHTNFTLVARNGKALLNGEAAGSSASSDEQEPTLTLKQVYEYATTIPLEQIVWLKHHTCHCQSRSLATREDLYLLLHILATEQECTENIAQTSTNITHCHSVECVVDGKLAIH